MINNTLKPLRILTWHIHGSYLFYLTQTPCLFYLPYKDSPEEGYGGRTSGIPWGDNVINVPANEVKHLEVDCLLFQSRKNYEHDQFEILSEQQRLLPRIYLEHDPPREAPTNTRHVVDDPEMLLLHVTHFNKLMWVNNRTPVKVIEHGVIVPDTADYTGELEKGIVVINGIVKRGRRLGLDVFERVRRDVPLDIVGMGSEEIGGLGEIKNTELSAFTSRYRFFFNPIRYTSLGLAVCEALMVGLPVVGLATTEMAVTIRNGYSGYIHTSVDVLIHYMKQLLLQPDLAQKCSEGARKTATEKFNIQRFAKDWLDTFEDVVTQHRVKNKVTAN